MLIHTSGVRVDHSDDYEHVLKTFAVLSDPQNKTFESYYEQMHAVAEARFPGEGDAICNYIARTVGRNVVVVMNSDPKSNLGGDYEPATNPTTPFTVAIGGNIVSRGVTFDNLLSMFFTRDVKHKILQDTYIQRARMFGSRGSYLKFFQLSIPEHLYRDWRRCFLFHSLALSAIKDTHRSPVWLQDTRVGVTGTASVDRVNVNVGSGEISFERFDLDVGAINTVVASEKEGAVERLKALQRVVGQEALPDYLLSFIGGMSPDGDRSIAIHSSSSIDGYTDKTVDKEQIVRPRGFIGTPQLEAARFPQAIHHVKVFYNANGKARVFYKYTDEGKIKFLRSTRRD